MAKVKIEVTNAVVGGKKHGEQLSVEQAEADRLVERGYAKVVKEATKPRSSSKKSESDSESK
jgi:hypothetical protein